jgi:hypothetical protein
VFDASLMSSQGATTVEQEGAKFAIVYFETHADALSASKKKLRLGGRNLSISPVPVPVSTMIETILILYLILHLFLLGGPGEKNPTSSDQSFSRAGAQVRTLSE